MARMTLAILLLGSLAHAEQRFIPVAPYGTTAQIALDTKYGMMCRTRVDLVQDDQFLPLCWDLLDAPEARIAKAKRQLSIDRVPLEWTQAPSKSKSGLQPCTFEGQTFCDRGAQ